MVDKYFPETLKTLPLWVLWKLEERDGRITKVPYNAKNGRRASSTDPKTWTTFDVVERELREKSRLYNGVGLMISKEYRIIFTDIDDCYDDGILDDRATDIIGAFQDPEGQYMEWSQSGRGLHVLAIGEIPRNFKNPSNGVEMYSEKRFCAMTGDALCNCEPHEEQSAIDYVFEKYATKKAKSEIAREYLPDYNGQTCDYKYIIRKASEREKKFPLLYEGDWEGAGYSSHSEADEALCLLLAFWTNRNPRAIDDIFRSSGLFREKWCRRDYRERTIANACDHCHETIEDYVRKRREEEVKQIERSFLQEW